MNDVVLGIILQLKDEATSQLNNFTKNVSDHRREMRRASTEAIMYGGAITALAVLAAHAADSSNMMGSAFNRTKAELGSLMKTIGEGALPIIVVFLNSLNGLLKIINLIPAPLLQSAGAVMLIGGSMLVAFGTILKFILVLQSLKKAMLELAVGQAILKALTGPVGWAQIGIGLGIAAASVGAIYGLSRMGSSGGAPAAQTVNINSQAFAGSKVEARKFGTTIQQITREGTRIGR